MQHRLYVQHQTNTSLPTSPTFGEDCGSPGPALGPTSLTFSGHRNSLMRGVKPVRSNILTELSTQDETITNHIQHINGQLGLLIDQLGKLEGLEQTSSCLLYTSDAADE